MIYTIVLGEENGMEFRLNIPVVFCVFSRLDTTKLVFEKIREAKPPRLYVVCDAPRDNKEGEKEKVDTVRRYIEENVDWDCEVKKNYAEKNTAEKLHNMQRKKR